MAVEIVSGLRSRPRLLAAFAAAAAVALVLPGSLHWSTVSLISWNAAVLLYLALVAHAMTGADAGAIRLKAQRQDDGAAAILFLTTLAIAFSFVAIAAELHVAHPDGGGGGGGGPDPSPSATSLALAGLTILLSWTVTQVTMALHYAGRYYADARNEGGLDFPGDDRDPDYADFLYFAFTMGAACQTSDVQVTSRPMRKLVLVHTCLAFLFNTTILALAVNVGASLI